MKAVFLLGSRSDMEHAEKIISVLDEWGVEHELFVASAHKVPEKVFNLVSSRNEEEGIVYVTIAGRSNGLSGVVGANSIHPVIACPPYKDKVDMMVNVNSTLMMPSDTPVLTVLDVNNAALSVVRIFALQDKVLADKLRVYLLSIKASFNV